MNKLKVAIIGTGHIARSVHIPGFIAAADTEVTAICSRDITRAKNIAQQYSITSAFDSIDAMLKVSRPDIVVVCTPNAFHHDAVIKALDAGSHVFCEKPAATNYSDARSMEKKAIHTGRILSYNFPLRQKPEIDILRQKIAEGFFGNIYHINASFLRRRGIPGWGNFTNKEIQGGGALIDIGIHILDLALHIKGYPGVKKVLANTYDLIGKMGTSATQGKWDHTSFTVEDSCFAHVSLSDHSSITLQAAFALNTKEERTKNLEIFGSQAGAILSPFELYTDKDGVVEITAIPLAEPNIQQLSIEKFIAACKGTETNICTAAEGSLLQEMIEMMYGGN